jgi:hypothetical protein
LWHAAVFASYTIFLIATHEIPTRAKAYSGMKNKAF